MSLYNLMRPLKFSEMVGNDSVIKSLKAIVKKKPEERPHAFLFSGPSGCGKTTLARILANEFGCSGIDLNELNVANTRGIDTIREVISNASLAPMGGKCRVYIFDECFSYDTDIQTNKGLEKIGNIKKGDIVYTLDGFKKVKNKFINTVILNRIVRLDFSDNSKIFCTEDHLFMTDNTWIKAKNLKKDFVLSRNYNILSDSVLLNTGKHIIIGGENDTWGKKILSEKMYRLWERIYSNSTQSIKMSGLQETNSCLQKLWEAVQIKFSKMYKFCPNFLFQKLFRKMEYNASFVSRKSIYRRSTNKNETCSIQIYKGESKEISTNKQTKFSSNEKTESNASEKKCRKNAFCKKIEWYFTYFFRRTWRKWSFYRTANEACFSFGLGNGGSNITWEMGKRLSKELQSGHREQRFKNSYRSGWKNTQFDRAAYKGFKKGEKTKRVRLESITFYESGNNDELFRDIITNKERNNGFINFYDLEIDGHPSYVANGFPVHNCHQLSRDAMNGLLKLLEDFPRDSYFMLCSTDPQKIIKTIHNRCSQFTVESLTIDGIADLIDNVLANLSQDVASDKVFDALCNAADGSPRRALSLLENILSVESEKDQLSLITSANIEGDVIELCRLLMRGGSWHEIAELYKAIPDKDAEGIRRIILGYFKSVLLGGGKNEQVGYNMIAIFEKSTFESGEPTLIKMLYEAATGR